MGEPMEVYSGSSSCFHILCSFHSLHTECAGSIPASPTQTNVFFIMI